jgi:hypothetical protein
MKFFIALYVYVFCVSLAISWVLGTLIEIVKPLL